MHVVNAGKVATGDLGGGLVSYTPTGAMVFVRYPWQRSLWPQRRGTDRLAARHAAQHEGETLALSKDDIAARVRNRQRHAALIRLRQP